MASGVPEFDFESTDLWKSSDLFLDPYYTATANELAKQTHGSDTVTVEIPFDHALRIGETVSEFSNPLTLRLVNVLLHARGQVITTSRLQELGFFSDRTEKPLSRSTYLIGPRKQVTAVELPEGTPLVAAERTTSGWEMVMSDRCLVVDVRVSQASNLADTLLARTINRSWVIERDFDEDNSEAYEIVDGTADLREYEAQLRAFLMGQANQRYSIASLGSRIDAVTTARRVTSDCFSQETKPEDFAQRLHDLNREIQRMR